VTKARNRGPLRASWASSPTTRRSMQSNRARDTGPEVEFRSALHRAGLRFFTHRRPFLSLRCTVDVVFPRARVAVFVDGCFWHCCPRHGSTPRSNSAYWLPKLARNVARDLEVRNALRRGGWTVLRVWEHELKGPLLQRSVRRIVRAIRRQRDL
jgi:DNA mismatch endonuclease, patch repair protein